MRALLVEDSPSDTRLLLAYLHERENSRRNLGERILVHNVTSLGEALTELKKAPYEAVLLDLGLPDSSGPETLHRFLAAGKSVPVIVLTGIDDEELGVRLLESGAQDYLPKSRITPELLEKSLRYAVIRRRAVADREQVENELHRSQRELQAIMDNAPALIWGKGRDGRYLFANTEFAHLRNSTPERIIDTIDEPGKYADLASNSPEEDRAVLELGTPVLRTVAGRVGGAEKFFMVSKFPLLAKTGKPYAVCAIAIDVTPQHVAESALRESDDRYREITSNIPGIVSQFRSDSTGIRLVFVSEGITDLTGLSSAEACRDPARLFEFIHESDRERLRREVFASFRAGERFSITLQVDSLKGETRHFRATASPRRDPQGGKIWDVVMLDVTEQFRLEELLQLSQRLDSIGKLAGGIAHDFNNLLTVISGRAKMAMRTLEEDAPARKNVEVISETSVRAAELVSQLLAFGRKQVMRISRVRVNAVVTEMRPMFGTLLPENIALDYDLDPYLNDIQVDRTRFEQVLMNLVANARDAMPEGGSLKIVTEQVDFGPGEVPPMPIMTPGRYSKISVRDAGIGMDEKTLAHAFEPFYTSKPKGKGTGLGLATVYGIVKQSNGWVWLSSRPGEGTTVDVYLPSASPHEVAETPADSTGSTPALEGAETILVAEDQDDLREYVREELESFGYRVLVAENPEAALKVYGREKKIDLLLTDVVMRGQTGKWLAEQILSKSPAMPVLYMSGYADEMVQRTGILTEDVVLLEKPFTSKGLVASIRKLLNRRDFPTKQK